MESSERDSVSLDFAVVLGSCLALAAERPGGTDFASPNPGGALGVGCSPGGMLGATPPRPGGAAGLPEVYVVGFVAGAETGFDTGVGVGVVDGVITGVVGVGVVDNGGGVGVGVGTFEDDRPERIEPGGAGEVDGVIEGIAPDIGVCEARRCSLIDEVGRG